MAFANSDADASTISFDGTVFSGGAASVLRLNQGELLIDETATIDGSTGMELVITGDAGANDALVAGTNITDVAATQTAGMLGDNSRVFQFASTANGSQISDLTITGGSGAAGGGIRSFANLTVADSAIAGNFASNAGGGLYRLRMAERCCNSPASPPRACSTRASIHQPSIRGISCSTCEESYNATNEGH